MMFRKLMAVATLAAVSATVASAQGAPAAVKPFSFGVFAGASVPVSDLGDEAKTGFTGGLTVGYKVATLPIGFRLDGSFQKFEGKVSNSLRTINVSANIVYDIPMQAAVRPYVIGGIGMYNNKLENADAENDLGFNIGGGVTIPLSGFETFIEARYNHVKIQDLNARFIPIVFGVRF